LFTQTRDEWFIAFVNSLNIPIHVFTSIRDTQLGQLMFAIETHRLKKVRAGEDPGPSLLAGDNAATFVPLFQTTKIIQDFLAKEEIEIDLMSIKKDFLANEQVKEFKKQKKSPTEWFSTQDAVRLDELFIPSANVLLEVLLPIIGEKLEIEDQEALFVKIKEIDETFGSTLLNLCDPVIFDAMKNKTWTQDDKDETIRIIKTKDEASPIQLSFNEYHSKTNVLYGLVLELIRIIESGKKYSLEFNWVTHLLTVEMLLMLPQPEKARIPVIKNHLTEIENLEASIPSDFWNLLSLSYQAFSHVLEPQQRMFQKVFKSIEKSFKQSARIFWRKILPKLESEDKKIRDATEQLLAVLWCHFRVVQAQTQQLTQDQEHAQHNYSYRVMLRFEHIFWQQGKQYLSVEKYQSKIHFWSTYASIANKEIRSPKDSLNLFNEFDALTQRSKVLTNKTQRKKFDITLRDHKSILQTILSYGLEGKDQSIYPSLKEYNKKMEIVLVDLENEIDSYPDISIKEEKQTVESVKKYLESPLEVQDQEVQERGRPVRRLRS
jgi:hypothetical protein